MTRPDLDALEALAAKATPGPWRVGIKHGHYVCETDDWITAECGSITRPGAYADNVALIVAAVNALPSLIAYVRELERDAANTARAHAVATREMAKEVALAMRERCARECEEAAQTRLSEGHDAPTMAAVCAAAIRALEP